MKKILKFIKTSKRLEFFLLFLILLLGFAVRLYKINSPIADWHSWRQVDTAAVARLYLRDGINFLEPRYYDISSIQTGYYNPDGYRFVEFPLYNAIHAAAYKLIPSINFEVWGRLVSIFSSIITAFALYKIGKKYGDKWVGLLAAFFFVFLPFNIYFSRVILPEPMATMFAIVSVWLFCVYIDTNKKLPLFISAASFAASILIKPYTIFYALPIAYLALKKFGLKGIIKNIPLLIALDIALVPFFLWRAWINVGTHFLGVPHIKWVFNGDGIRFRPAFWRWIFGERLGNLVLGGWGLIPFIFGVLEKKRKSLVPMLMLLGMFAYVTIIATASIRHDYYQTIAIPAIALTLGFGANHIWNTNQFSLLKRRITLCFCLFMMFGMSAYQVKEFYKVNHPEFVEVGKIADETLPTDALVIAPDNGNTVFLYYTKRQGWPVLETNIEDAIKLGADYFISVNNDPDTARFRERFEAVKQDGTKWIILDLHKVREPQKEKKQ